MTDKWLDIVETFKKAERYRWGDGQYPPYHTDGEKVGMYLYPAYYRALMEEEKEHLWYGRILMMMYEEHRGRYDEYSLFHCFLKEAYCEYMLAVDSGDEGTEKLEIDRAGRMYEKSKRYIDMLGCRKDQRNELAELLGGRALPDGFDFRGCSIAGFRHDAGSAVLKLAYHGDIVTLRFSDIYRISAELVPAASRISGLSCRRCDDAGAVLFDIGYYKILCGSVEVVDE